MELTKRILIELIGIDSTFGNEAAIGRYLRGLFEHRGYQLTEQDILSTAGGSRTARRHNLIIERSPTLNGRSSPDNPHNQLLTTNN